MTATTTHLITFNVLTCCREGCGIQFAVPAWWEGKRREDHSSWYCPNGHSQYFPGKSDLERARDRAQRAENNASFWRDQELAARRSAAAQKAAKTRLKNRIAKGVCPCCNRHFANVQRHIANQHPEFAGVDRTSGEEA